MKHWDGCWRYASHHTCAVAEVKRLRGELEEIQMVIRKLAEICRGLAKYGAGWESLGLLLDEAVGEGDQDVIETAVREALGEEAA